MYLISAYFDDKTNKKIESFITKIAEQTGNTFMTDNHVPPHLTISALEARNEVVLLPYMDRLSDKLEAGTVQMVSVGALFPYVLYMTPVLNGYLQNLSQRVYDIFTPIEEVSVSRFYQPMQWLPHVTLGKTLTKEQMQTAFRIMQESFAPMEGRIERIGLAKTNPHEDIVEINLYERGKYEKL